MGRQQVGPVATPSSPVPAGCWARGGGAKVVGVYAAGHAQQPTPKPRQRDSISLPKIAARKTRRRHACHETYSGYGPLGDAHRRRLPHPGRGRCGSCTWSAHPSFSAGMLGQSLRVSWSSASPWGFEGCAACRMGLGQLLAVAPSLQVAAACLEGAPGCAAAGIHSPASSLPCL